MLFSQTVFLKVYLLLNTNFTNQNSEWLVIVLTVFLYLYHTVIECAWILFLNVRLSFFLFFLNLKSKLLKFIFKVSTKSQFFSLLAKYESILWGRSLLLHLFSACSSLFICKIKFSPFLKSQPGNIPTFFLFYLTKKYLVIFHFLLF